MTTGEAARDVFRAISDPTRRAMLDLLRHGDRSAGELGGPFDMSRPAVSQHLRVLQDAGLIRGHQKGRSRVYRLTARPLRDVCEWADRYADVVDLSGNQWRVRRHHRPLRPAEDAIRPSRWLAGLFAALAAQPTAARERPAPPQGAAAFATPGAEHRRLETLAGAWTLEVQVRLAPNAAWTISSGRAEYRVILGGRFVSEEASVGLGRAQFEWRGLYGYDTRAGKYTASWVDNGDTGIEHADGVLDGASKAIVFSGERSGASGGMEPYEWVLRVESPDRFTIEMRSPGPSGAEFADMRLTGTRRPAPASQER
jgi:DNA-binding transcriptional ArsR family regulator